MSNLLYDPKLKELAEKISKLIDEYNAVGFVQLVSPTHAEYLNKLQDWSGIVIEDNYAKIRIKQKELGKKKAKKLTENSVHVLHSISRISVNNLELCEKLIEMIQESGIEITRDISKPYSDEN